MESLIDDVPRVYRACEMFDDGLNVIGHELRKFVPGPPLLAEPLWNSLMPQQGVTTDRHSILFGKTHEFIRRREIEAISRRTQQRPLHLVLRFELIELTRQCRGIAAVRANESGFGGAADANLAVSRSAQVFCGER